MPEKQGVSSFLNAKMRIERRLLALIFSMRARAPFRATDDDDDDGCVDDGCW